VRIRQHHTHRQESGICRFVYCRGLKTAISNGELVIVQEGKTKKFVDLVEQVTFSGKYAAKAKQPLLYVTERCVFTIENEQMTLIEIAPGIDLERTY